MGANNRIIADLNIVQDSYITSYPAILPDFNSSDRILIFSQDLCTIFFVLVLMVMVI